MAIDNTSGDNKGADSKNSDLDIQNKGDQVLSESINSLPIISQILDTLGHKLPKNLYYHAKSHTDDVLREVVIFALVDGLSLDDMRLLAVAAAFHDAGFIESPVDNERIGAHMARKAMEGSGIFSPYDIETVSKMILDTRLVETRGGLKQVASTDLSRYLLDADLSNFGREDFFEKAELQRKELGYDRELFLRKTFELINNHRWFTNAALKLRQQQKSENIAKLKAILQTGSNDFSISALELGVERIGFLAKLPLLLNSSLKTQKVIDLAIEHLKNRISAEAATVFILNGDSKELTFWAMSGGDEGRLEGIQMPSDRGIVGWVIANQETALVNNVQKDPRFFQTIDEEGGGFVSRNLICVPLTVRGDVVIGAIQVLNKLNDQDFTEDDQLFLEQFGHQVALSIDNASLHEALEARNKQLAVLDRRKNDMIQVISHEFRTPLNVIQTSSELIASGYIKDAKAVTEISATLTRGVDKLAKLISQIRNISMLSEDKVDVEFEKVIVSEIFETIKKKFQSGAKKRKVSLTFKLPDKISNVNGSYTLLVVALDNLVSNAIRYTPDEGSVEVSASQAAGFVKISVKDSGIGIEPSEIPLIFEKFYEVTDTMQHSSGDLEFKSAGLGLGLSTVRSILQAHGSSIDVASKPGSGSTFSFNLPVSG
jgi:signal transduction histidine kinase/predicted metal-dependent HD superfamily phosphohydrolase